VFQAPANDVVLTVRVVPRAAKSGVAGRRGDDWLVRLHAPPVEGAANAELIAVLAAALGVPKRAVTIVSGESSRQKRVQVAGIDAATAERQLLSAVSTFG
jgi:uncharacterized protein (TIGR00251 family)